MIGAALALVYAMFNYSTTKSVVTDNMRNASATAVPNHVANLPEKDKDKTNQY